MTDYKALYEQQLEENKKLKKRLTHNTTTIRKLKKDFDCLEAEATFENEKLIAEVKQLKPVSKDTEKEYDYVFESQRKEIIELKDKVKYLENEVCRYSNAIEEEYVLKTDYEQLENDSLVSHCDHCNVCLSYDDFNISLDVGHRCCEMCFEEKKLKDRDQETEEEEEEEICINCDRKKKGPGDMFIIHQELFHGVKENWCSQCYMKKLGE